MGSCVSSSHNNKTSSASDSAVKLQPFILQPDTTSPLKNDVINSVTINENPLINSGRHDSGIKEEIIFFDSQGCFYSDSEDDFMSVNGEFTPSRGTTPVHHKFTDQSPQEVDNKTHQEPSPTDNKKRLLLELFKETQDEEDEQEEDYMAEGKSRSSCLWLRTPVKSSAPTTPYNNNKERQQQQQQQIKWVRSASHGRSCVLRFVSCSSFNERRQKMMNHAPIDVQR